MPGLDVVEEGGRQEVAVLATVEVAAPAVDDEGRAVPHTGVEVGGDLVAVLLRHQRAHVAALGAVAGAQLAHPVLDLRDQLVGDGLDGHERGDRHAALTGRAEAGVDRGVGSEVEVGVGEHQHVVLGPAEGLHTLAVGGSGLVDVARDRGGPHERHRLDVGVDEQRVDGLLVAVDDVHDAVGQAGLLPQRGHRERRGRVLLARLEDDRVAAGDGDGDEPHRHHGGEVEGRDDRDDPERLPDRVDVDARRRVLAEPTLEQVGDAAGELGHLETAGHLAEGVVEHLAVLGRDQRRDVLLAGVEQLAELEQHLAAPGE
jgi:hypothetical protein